MSDKNDIKCGKAAAQFRAVAVSHNSKKVK